MTMPNFLVIGAAKGGTTALHRYLKQHPQIFMSPRKELRFFPFEGNPPDYRGPGDAADAASMTTTLDDYVAQFEGSEGYPARGEISPLYLYMPRSVERIRHYIPDVKLIAVLRQPAERAYSQYLMMKRDGLETLGFEDALAAEDRRVAERYGHRWYYLRRGFYAAQLRPYFANFARGQIRVRLYEDYVSNPVAFAQDIFRFLNVDDTFVPDMSVRHNESKLPRSRRLQVFLTQPRAAKNFVKTFIPAGWSRRVGDRLRRENLTRPPLPPETRRRLTEVYREDIEELQGMIGRDLSHWLA
jgi:hypothetical protein